MEREDGSYFDTTGTGNSVNVGHPAAPGLGLGLIMDSQRFLGSPEVYEASRRSPLSSINFVTAHDGFTLHDLTSYSSKHNAANGEDNQDGEADNKSANNGAEGPTDDAGVNPDARSVMFVLGHAGADTFVLLLNAAENGVEFTIPEARGTAWELASSSDPGQ